MKKSKAKSSSELLLAQKSTLIKIKYSTKWKLDSLKQHLRETYDDVIKYLIKNFEE